MWPFKKKEDELAKFERELGLDLSKEQQKPPEESFDRLNEPLSHEELPIEKPLFERPQMQQLPQSTDMQLLSAKLDTVKAMLDMINQRLESLEKSFKEEKPKKMW